MYELAMFVLGITALATAAALILAVKLHRKNKRRNKGDSPKE